jgi:hypothetical protein
MRLSLLCASAAIATGLALSACSNGPGTSSALPSAGSQTSPASRSLGQNPAIHLMPGVRPLTGPGCSSVYAFCFYVTPHNPGPYVETSAGSGYELYNAAWITRNSSGQIANAFKTYFDPYPGNPTYQYIKYRGKNPKKPTPVKFTDYYCIGFSPSACNGSNYTFKLGIALTPAT